MSDNIFTQINKLFPAAQKNQLLVVTLIVLGILLELTCKLDSAAPALHQIVYLALICAIIIVFIFFIKQMKNPNWMK